MPLTDSFGCARALRSTWSLLCFLGATACGSIVQIEPGDPISTPDDPAMGPGAQGDAGPDDPGGFDLPDDPETVTDSGMPTCTGTDCDEPRCGDGVLDDGEECDDGDSVPGDGCSGACNVEPNFACDDPGEPCVSTIVCGDGEIGGGEACDDGNPDDSDGCSSDCVVEAGFGCATPGDPCVPSPVSVCGNSIVESGETCDDGAAIDLDGCSDTCQVEPGFTCSMPGDPCVANEFCGNGNLAGAEQCDDSNTTPGDGCTGVCTIEPFFDCPTPGQLCETQIVCNDLQVIGDEACDDGNTLASDGCAADCKTVEPGFTCPSAQGVGGDCQPVPVAACPDAILQFGEACDDGNATDGDGCTDCLVDPGHTCSAAGAACELIEYCGDGAWDQINEGCDNGSLCTDLVTDCSTDATVCVGIGDDSCSPVGGDGCSATCVVENNFNCANGTSCVSTVVCGDGIVTGTETCDDGNTTALDGCDDTCQLEPGYICPPGRPCIEAECGDGIQVGFEECDDGDANSGDGCSYPDCELEEGFKCDVPPGDPCTTTTTTTCGDGIPEGAEPCDDGNNDTGDGCTPLCQNEPSCVDANGVRMACTSVCGDGVRLPGDPIEACDDGNLRNDDGCSDVCEVEPGYTCSAPLTEPAVLDLPIVYRDFDAGPPVDSGHPDFQWPAPFNGFNNFHQGFARATLGANADDNALNPSGLEATFVGKPIFAYQAADSNSDGLADNCPLDTNDLVRNGIPYCAETVQDADSFHGWYRDGTLAMAVVDTLPLTLTGTNTYVFDSEDLPDGFFPIDGLGFAGSDPDCDAGSPNGQPNDHNFLFTSEVRYFFQHNQVNDATLTFRGDDDVFVFVNGILALDLGGVHSALLGVLNVDDDTAVICDDVGGGPMGEPNSVCDMGETVLASDAPSLSLVDGSIYEIVVFQAERNQCLSNYRLELRNFLLQGTDCTPMCGDGMVTRDEVCDDPNGNVDGVYGGCDTNCMPNAFCGDGNTDTPPEDCDTGVSVVAYGGTSSTACGPGCLFAPYCGDGSIDGANGEECDDGVAANTGAYDACTPGCQLGPRCGDGVGNGPEECDDGVLNGTSGSTCESTCMLKCGNGTLDAGEQCDDGAANTGGYDNCTPTCTLGPFCGDGVRQAGNGEECDDGLNDGSYGFCAPECLLGPRCGDGLIQDTAGEVCDEGAANAANAYGEGLCLTSCQPAPYCGDSAVNVAEGELCDDGVNDNTPGSCTPDCSGFVPLPDCGDGNVDSGEECDTGANNGTQGGSCDINCRTRCGNGFVDPGETCDDGINDGSYGGCAADCTPAGYCGDDTINGPETCDEGAQNQANPYGEDLCTQGCQPAPYCGDNRIQTAFGEECDGQSGCGTDCQFDVIIQ